MTSSDGEADDWRPIIDGVGAIEARAVIGDIASSLIELDEVRADLTTGASGIAVFYSYFAAAAEHEPSYEHATRYLERAALLAPSELSTSSLWGGYTGLGWVLSHLSEGDELDANDAIDRALTRALDVERWAGDYDLINGLAGLALYALERLPRPSAHDALNSIVAHLARLAEIHETGITWFTPPHLLMPQQLAHAPNGYFNLGLAHGVPALVNVLGRIVQASIALDDSRRLLQGSVDWLLAQRRRDSETRFPYWITDGQAGSGPARNAWCYGDLGVAAALYGAGRFVGESAWQAEALALARGAANRAPQQSGVVDGGLCHGALGLAHMFMRFYNATRESGFRGAANIWLGHALALRRPREAFAGFPMWDANIRGFAPDPGLLTGAAGVGLVLLAATSRVRPAWDRVLLLDLDGR